MCTYCHTSYQHLAVLDFAVYTVFTLICVYFVFFSYCIVGHLRWPAFKRGHCEQSHHGHEHVIKVEIAVVPLTLLNDRLIHVSLLIQDIRSPEKENQINK